ncbi:uncharacterized protein KGF55_001422 [Candida pseudojiufengensis]|uniref:uncharacterized protein n=1 Tax=Candida pseudojiufengensis TaxID=497109 RepID=UPI0022247E92|nr:uncharacterized protein KGF55_001422 [Candida pseudojiufengensis]KAI5965202.1 hypothetical protein KGF55_001422 [Candida pseudojiufengensis]
MSSNDITNGYIYDLDEGLLHSLKLLSFDITTFETVESKNESTISPKVTPKTIDYYKSDLHRYNLKRAQRNLPPINEEEFENILETQSIESLSGSEEESDDNLEDETDNNQQELKVDSLIKNLEKMEIKENESYKSHLNTRSPFLLFASSMITNESAIGVYKITFNEDNINDPLNTLQNSQRINNAKSAIFMIGGGHFAGAIISHERKPNSTKASKLDRVNLIESKTFHRYTTRRKQGGAQSASDKTRGKAISTGSSIRRYNEKALMEEVRELLSRWAQLLNECEAIYIRANGPTNKKVLIGYENSPLRADDKRIHKIPFSTQRASLSEVKRSWVELTHLKVVEIPKVVVASENETKQKEIGEKTERSKEDKRSNDISNEIMPHFKKQKAPKFLKWVSDNSIDVNTFQINSDESLNNTPTFLHYASSHGLSHMIHVLLVNLKASPLVKNYAGRYPAEVGTPASKKAFQIARFNLGEEFCDWEEAKVGIPKSKEQFEEEDRIIEDAARAEKKNLLRSQIDAKTTTNTAQSQMNLDRNFAGLSDDQKTKIMREQRARAAEARMKQKCIT